VLIDFTRPEGTLKHLEFCAAHGVKVVIGTTGFKPKARPPSPNSPRRPPSWPHPT
jgi:dihydrodipicolinate reductase